MSDDLLGVEEVAGCLGVGRLTVYRWCRDGSLPCFKIGKSWRVRREALEEFVRRSESSDTLAERLRSFLRVPDSVFAVVQNTELIHRLDTAFFQIGEAQGAVLIKYYAADSAASPASLRDALKGNGLELERLEEEGRFHFIGEPNPESGQVEELRRVVSEEAGRGDRPVWVSFNWAEWLDLDVVMRQEEVITEFVEDSRLTVKTAVLERMLDECPGEMQRRAQLLHASALWLSEAGLALSRVEPLAR